MSDLELFDFSDENEAVIESLRSLLDSERSDTERLQRENDALRQRVAELEDMVGRFLARNGHHGWVKVDDQTQDNA